MALDNANFISELSIVDPPGTDPLSQGDDQIRTVKRATQQSFPNIDAAVTLTPVQLNLAAIKNENNEFTVTQTFQGNIVIDALSDLQRSLNFRISGLNRWQHHMLNLAGGNDYRFDRLDALGSFVDSPYRIAAATGVVDFLQVPTVAGAPLWIAGEIRMFVAIATPGPNWFVADGTNGTVNLDNRVLTGEGSSSPGTLLAPNLVGQLSSGVSGATALSEAQMPNHRHRVAEKSLSGGQVQANPATTLAAGQGLAGVILSTGTQSYADQTADARSIVENSGSSQSHTHTVSTVVTENGATRDTVRPLSAVVQYHQYVP